MHTQNAFQSNEIAIIGMTGQFPKSPSLDIFWDNLCNKRELISFFTDEELLEAGIGKQILQNTNYIKAKGVLENIDYFDARFFNYSVREAEYIDPQQRLFLQWAWTALEDAGYNPDQYEDLIGVFASSSFSSYFHLNLLPYLRDSLDNQDEMLMIMGNEKDFLATRTSYKLNLKGPSKTIQTACSSSLVAIHDACQSLINYECDMAIAGGVCATFPQKSGYFYTKEGINSPDGHCRAYDHRAGGTLGGNGGGVIVLKRLADALAEGDTIRAIIKGSAVNNDGGRKVGYTAPSIEGQAQVIALAQLVANVHPETISYIEGHGTGTILGDPIEIAALTAAFQTQTQAKQFCAIGSVKTNIGHLDAASGVAGFIKTVLCLEHRQITPTLHFEKANPQISFDQSPFYVNREVSVWERTPNPLRAGVSSFGIGGTNAHIILEEAPSPINYPSSRSHHILLFSSKSQKELQELLTSFDYILQKLPYSLADIAYTLQVGRKSFEHRVFFICTTKEEAQNHIKKYFLLKTEKIDVPTWLPEKENVLKWREGETVDWTFLYKNEKRRRVPLPTYPFNKQRYLIFPKSSPSFLVEASNSFKDQTQKKSAFIATQNKLEKFLVSIWESALRTKGIGIDDNFFSLGGDSLLALEVTETLRKHLFVNVDLGHLLKHPSIRLIALFIREEMITKIPELSEQEASFLLEIL